MNGGVINGIHLDPVTYIVAGLHRNFANLDEETRLAAVTEFLAFQRRQVENTNTLIARYELVRNRARNEGNFDMGAEGNSLTILRATNQSVEQLEHLLRPTNGSLPHTEDEFRELCE
jgi:hypothetical protein